MVRIILSAIVIGFAFWLYNAKFVESVALWGLISAVALFVVMLLFARALGPLSPTFGEAGGTWVDWAKKFGPTALAGYVIGWIIWPLRVDSYSALWMPLLGAGLALFIRSIALQIIRGRPTPDSAEEAPDFSADGESGTMVAAEVD